MAVSNAKAAKNTHLLLAEVATPTVLDGIGEVKDISGPTNKMDAIDASMQDSDSGYKEQKGGLLDGGEVTIIGNWWPADTVGQVRLMTAHQAKTLNQYMLQSVDFPPKAWTFMGFCTALDVEYPVAGLMGFKATVKISGKPTFGTPPF